MKPKIKITLTIFSFFALVLTGLAAAEQIPTKGEKSADPLFSPNIISLSPKLIHRKRQFEKTPEEIRRTDSLILNNQPSR